MKYFIGIVIAAIIIIAGLYYFSASPTTPTAPEIGTTSPPAGEAGAAAPYDNEAATRSSYGTAPGGTGTTTPSAGATVTYTASGFSPKTVTIKKGESVTFVNQSGGGMWVASVRHPDHTVYSGTTRTAHCPDTTGVAFDQCATGDTYTFTFQKTGRWGYHNHVDIGDTGTVIVQ